MTDYKLGKIYKIISVNTDKVYIGSSAQKYLSKRMGTHNEKYTKYKNGTYHYVSSFDIIEKGQAKIVLLESFPCNSVDELRAREQYWIENTPNCVNKFKAYRTEEEAKEYDRECARKSRLKYKDDKEYHDNIRTKRREQIILCPNCNIETNKDHYARHCRSKAHLSKL